MRKISKTMEPEAQRYGVDVELEDTRQKGAVVTCWPSVIAVDLITLPGEHPGGATVIGGLACQKATEQESNRRTGPLALSDGTQVTFTTAGRFIVVQSD